MSFLKKKNLKKKTIYVLGGSGLIGSKVVNNIISLGPNIVVLDIKKNNLNKKVKFEKFDCSNLNQIEKKFSKIVKKFGCPHIFINCSYPRTKSWSSGSFKKVTLKIMRKNIDKHLHSYSWLSKLVADEMVKKNIKGSIINMNSIYGLLGQDLNIYEKTSIKENMLYSIIKGGMVNLVRQMASYYGTHGIRINNVCSGGLKGHMAGNSMLQEKNFVKNYSKKTPLKRLGEPEEVANVIIFLATDASSYITGSNLVVDGGWTSI